MPAHRAYLDHNATSPIRPEALAAAAEAMRSCGNPSSVHAEGRTARSRVERARAQVAGLVGARPEDVTFTSSGTEANNTALRPGALTREGRSAARLVVSDGEHASVLEGHGYDPGSVARLAIGPDGRVRPGDVERCLEATGPDVLVSLQVANSETGVLQPVAAIAALVRERGGLVHADAVQAAGRVPLGIQALGVDALTLSAHKLGAPMGIGAVVLAPGRDGPQISLLRGGGQEGRRRAGTENVPAIVGFGVAAELASRDLATEAVRLRELRDHAEREIRRIAPGAVIFGESVERLPNTVSFAVPGLAAETALISLDLDGVALSSGSACSSGKVARSHVLAAMGVPDELARGALRLSFGWNSCPADVAAFARAFEKLVGRLYERDRARAA